MKQKYVLTFILSLSCLLLQIHCGTGVGNPSNLPSDQSIQYPLFMDLNETSFEDLLDAYQDSVSAADPSVLDCGRFDQTNSSQDILDGQACIRTALDNCSQAYYLNDQNEGTVRTLSFVQVQTTVNNNCDVIIQTTSNDPTIFDKQAVGRCNSLDNSDIEFQCDIL